MKARRLAAAALTAIESEIDGVAPVLVNWIVMLLATLCERLVNVTTPSTDVRLIVPCKVPLPARRVAVTTVPAEMPLAALRRLPN